jgi:hypothetical protein
MPVLRMRILLLATVLLQVAACARSSTTADLPPEASPPPIASRPNDPPGATPSGTASGAGAGVAIACKADAECPSLPCGPCTPGAVITREALTGPQCTVNPCRHAEGACSPQHVCVVGPRAEKEPAVWRTPPASH